MGRKDQYRPTCGRDLSGCGFLELDDHFAGVATCIDPIQNIPSNPRLVRTVGLL